MVDPRSRRGFQEVTADAGMDQATNILGFDFGCFNRHPSACDTGGAGERSWCPNPPLGDSTHELQATLGKFEPLIKWKQLVFYLQARPNLGGKLDTDRLDANVFESQVKLEFQVINGVH